jgi:hypothetical protein
MSLKNKLHDITPLHAHIVGALVLSAIVASSLGFLASAWSDRRAQVVTTNATLANLDSELDRARALRADLIRVVNEREAALTTRTDQVRPATTNELAAELAALAERHAIRVESLEPEKIIASRNVVPLRLTLATTYADLESWLAQLHDQYPDVHIESLEIRTSSPDSPDLSVNIRIDWHKPTPA